MIRTLGNMTAVGYFVSEFNSPKRGEYKETELDLRKKQVDFLLISIDGSRYEVRFNNNIEIKENRSIKKAKDRNNIYYVTEKAFDALKKKYSYECDF